MRPGRPPANNGSAIMYGEMETRPTWGAGPLLLLTADTQDEGESDSAIDTMGSSEAAAPEDARNSSMFLPDGRKKTHQHNLSLVSNVSTLSALSLMSAEEEFEDYGEGDETDLTDLTEGSAGELPGEAAQNSASSLPSSANNTPKKYPHLLTQEALHNYCLSCARKMDQLNSLDTRLRKLEVNSPNRRISSKAYARHLLQTSNLSSTNGSTENLEVESRDPAENDIADKLNALERKVCEMENDSTESGDLHTKLRQENKQLTLRVHELEERLRDEESRSEQSAREDARRHRDALARLERDKGEQTEALTTRLQQLEEENKEIKAAVVYLKAQTQKLETTNRELTEGLDDGSMRLREEARHSKELADRLHRTQQEHNVERDTTQEMIEGLRRELEVLQVYKLDADRGGRRRTPSVSTISSDMEQEARRLRQDVQRLKEQNEDLNAQIISLSIQEAKNLCLATPKFQSLAAEIDSASKDEVMEALREQEEINFRLRQYMDKIILAILDTNPSILEIKT
ncbi:rab11 family-interacting protein 4-like [Lethenteron reissneri]|uniref:rab11 family-interacting protein 4-like n=1 Tax=Lethenteron reissneri TaxID=7753 RepID=UPI002AB72DCA|nr:rab11 family-interacting protein 4-like [Lethenteron reissneri]